MINKYAIGICQSHSQWRGKYFEMKTVVQALKQANYKEPFSNIAELHDQVQMLAAENEQMIHATADMALQIAEVNAANQL
ncbi:hypothetical protein AJ79_10367 [Helicocarpus griseus UAMH5409]|uniref:Uncharacterized protein n=1 Tax=Helicocarpus griseus UAMH5409 TaxID=1447875 RepID=A0A2B7WED5_9EURO|nr:hypothetical protein AJ79_10367 [Helicocarpus griseus UAMH5409]